MYLPPHLAHLPPPSVEAAALSEALCAHIARDIEASGGCISFARYMELALYAPGMGYYTAGSRKLGEVGDFITAPEMTPLFTQCVARQAAQVALPHVLELGAGSGALAVEMLLELERLSALPHEYAILEISADLRERQRERIARLPAQLAARVRWLDALPDPFEGLILANEVLDATPAHLLTMREHEVLEGFVRCAPGAPRDAPLGLAALQQLRAGEGWTNLFIYPPYEFSIANRMITNFHQPGTGLLLLMNAIMPSDLLRRAYSEALAAGYRFLSYGDATLVL